MSIGFKRLQEISEDNLFWPGTVFRITNVGMNVENKDDDFYDYMLVNLPWDKEYLSLINITPNNIKAGSFLASVKVEGNQNSKVVTLKAIKYSIGEENVFLKLDSVIENDNGAN